MGWQVRGRDQPGAEGETWLPAVTFLIKLIMLRSHDYGTGMATCVRRALRWSCSIPGPAFYRWRMQDRTRMAARCIAQVPAFELKRAGFDHFACVRIHFVC